MKQLVLGVALTAIVASACGGSDGPSGSTTNPIEPIECPPDSSLTYENFGKPFTDDYCAGCHAADKKGAERQKAPPEDIFDTVEQIREGADELTELVVESTKMPFATAKKQPTKGERAMFGEWLACGAP